MALARSTHSFLKNSHLVLDDGTLIYPNPRYANDIVRTLGMQEAKPVPTPIVKLRHETDAERPVEDPEQIKLYRHCVSVTLFLCNYKPEVNFAVKELSRGLQTPSEEDFKRLKHFARFLIDSSDFGVWFPAAGNDHEVAVWTDSDWAQDKIDRTITTCFNIVAGDCFPVPPK